MSGEIPTVFVAPKGEPGTPIYNLFLTLNVVLLCKANHIISTSHELQHIWRNAHCQLLFMRSRCYSGDVMSHNQTCLHLILYFPLWRSVLFTLWTHLLTPPCCCCCATCWWRDQTTRMLKYSFSCPAPLHSFWITDRQRRVTWDTVHPIDFVAIRNKVTNCIAGFTWGRMLPLSPRL